MDIGAEFTLQIARFAQDRLIPPRSAARWYLLPGGVPLTWAEARAALGALPKPVIVAPLTEPGTLGFWGPAMFDANMRSWFDHHLTNQVQYWQKKLQVCGVTHTSSVVFAPATPALTLTGQEFLQWTSDYVIGVPVTMRGTPGGGPGRFVIVHPGGGGPPLGMDDPYAPAS